VTTSLIAACWAITRLLSSTTVVFAAATRPWAAVTTASACSELTRAAIMTPFAVAR
jgi:hypothetical protein